MTVFSFVATFIIAKVIGLVMKTRVSEEDECAGLDTAIHGESAYDFGGVSAHGQCAPSTRRRPTGRTPRRGGRMKQITAVIKPFKLDDVKAALEVLGVRG